MIDPHWQLVDLDPRTWRNIGRFINPGLYIRAGNPASKANRSARTARMTFLPNQFSLRQG